jgi:hypothetical protein
MPKLPPEHYLQPDDLRRLRELEMTLTDLHQQRHPLAEKLRNGTLSHEEGPQVVRLNAEIVKAAGERNALLDKNPLLAKNQPGWSGDL